MKKKEKARQLEEQDSPESLVLPYRDLSTMQKGMSGEQLPEIIFGICDSCHWCYTCINERGFIRACPVCDGIVSRIPMNIDEVCHVEDDPTRGMTLRFGRKLPLR